MKINIYPFLRAMGEDWLGGGTITMKLQKVNPNELVIFSMVWREINRVMESTSLRKRQSIKICTDKTHNRDRDLENVKDKS